MTMASASIGRSESNQRVPSRALDASSRTVPLSGAVAAVGVTLASYRIIEPMMSADSKKVAPLTANGKFLDAAYRNPAHAGPTRPLPASWILARYPLKRESAATGTTSGTRADELISKNT
jgi:hypothetical protein